MSREQEDNRFKLTEDLINILRYSSNLQGYASDSRNASAAFHNIISGGDQDVMQRSSVVHTYEGNASSSSALEALQSYGQRVQSPSSSHQWNDWNIDYDESISRKKHYGMEQATATKSSNVSNTPAHLNQMYGSESCMTPKDCAFVGLDLKTVDDEDDFLYGDSNSIPEAPRSLLEDSAKSNQQKSVPTWSDDEDPYDEPTDGFRKTSVWNIQNKQVESTKFLQSRQEGKVSDLVKEPISILKSSKAQFLSSAKDLAVTRGTRDSPNTTTTKSKYHAAAEILKKQTTEKNKSMSKISSNEKVDIFSGSLPSTENKDSGMKANKPSVKGQRQLPKAFIDQKHLDNIKEYIKRPERKRSQPYVDIGPESKHLKQESSINPSSTKYPAHNSRYKSPYHDYRDRSPNRSRHKSPDYKRFPSPHHSRDRSPDYEHHSRHRSSERRRRYSRSPIRRSRRSRSRSKSPTRRSRTPPYVSSRDKSYDKYKKSAPKSHRTPDRYIKKKQKSRDNSSSDSVVTVSLGSESDSSSDSSDESSDEKRKNTSKRLPKKPVSKGGEKNTKVDTKSIPEASFLTEDLSKNLVDLFSVSDKTTKDTDSTSDMFNNKDNFNDIVKMLENPQLLTQIVEGIQKEHPSVSTATGDINAASNSQMPVIPCPQIYSYAAAPFVPVPYMPPQVPPHFPPMLAPASLPPPSEIPSVLANEHDPYELPVSSKRKSVNPRLPCRRQCLREIPVSDSLSTNSTLDTNIKSVSVKSKELDTLKYAVDEHIKLSTHGSKQSYEKQSKEDKLKESEKHVSQPKPEIVNGSVLIGMFKKLKAERHIVHSRIKNTADDMLEMESKLQSTFGKKVDEEQKVLHTRCKNLFNVTSDSFAYLLRDAKHADEELNKFKAKLPKELQAEVSKIKLEQCIGEETCEETYSCYDDGKHTCCPCNKQFSSIASMLEHFHSSEHKERTVTDVAWMKYFKKEVKKIDEKKASLEPAKGVEFLKPLQGYFCSLCNETIVDNENAEQHIKSHTHFVKYKNHVKMNPAYEKRYEYLLKNAQKVKEVTKINSDDFSSGNKKFSDKIIAKEDNDESNKNLTCSIKPKNKTNHKFIFIGKAPNYRKSQVEKK